MTAKKATEQVTVSRGIGVGGLSFVILCTLKLTGIIDMGWFWVLTSFIWVPLMIIAIFLGIVFGFVALVFIGAMIMALISDLTSKLGKMKNG